MTSLRIKEACLMCVALVAMIAFVSAAPAQGEPEGPPIPYEYKYEVKDPEKNLFFGANEIGDGKEDGKTAGAYRVLLPDGRLMTVEYTVEGESGFVPKISFEENAKPF